MALADAPRACDIQGGQNLQDHPHPFSSHSGVALECSGDPVARRALAISDVGDTSGTAISHIQVVDGQYRNGVLLAGPTGLKNDDGSVTEPIAELIRSIGVRDAAAGWAALEAAAGVLALTRRSIR
jgi:hypothetical protein